MASRRRVRLAKALSSDDRYAFDRDGFVVKRDFLPQPVFDRLRSEVLDYAGPAREMLQGDTITRRIALGPDAMRAMPTVRTLLVDQTWRALLRYVGSHDAEPLFYIQTILSHACDAGPDPQTALHADTFHATLKAWFFLTDVALDEGPLCYVAGSHRDTPARVAWEKRRSIRVRTGGDHLSSRGSLRIRADELPGLGLPPPRPFAVPANTLIVADTHGFHARASSARPSIRVEIWAYGRGNPFLPWSGLSLGSLPGIAERRIGWLWAFRDRFEALVGQPWRDVGRKRPGDAG